MKKTAKINKIIPFSNVDGPSNRMAIFFQGCPFDCLFCHNPETINLCVSCGKCVATCPSNALTIDDGSVVWNKLLCVNCDTCISVCENSASPKVVDMTVSGLLDEIKKAAPYIDGITTSGGECTLYHNFLLELFPLVKELGLTVLVDSNGSYDFSADPRLLDVVDGVMLDVKAVDKDWSDKLISYPNDIVLKILEFLLNNNKLHEVRTVLFPNHDKENKDTIKYVSSIIQDKCDYKLIRYRPFGVRKENQKIVGDTTTEEDYAKECVEYAVSCGATKSYYW
ncbi:MAG: YjjW family glycine radical enzyme activase [Firmicutes bacterium]|nr:YjjW family glycine radical enzyme activase [Bacillota bacterium]